MKRLYALLVGIDAYVIPQPLRGCVADIREYDEFLTHRVALETYEVHRRVLLNQQATREAVILGFREHLANAGPQDTALFVFCGHGGSQESEPESLKIEPDRMDETLVCYDSRLPGGFDLCDKFLAQLIEEVATRGAHILVVLDSCHSASGTREAPDPTVRSAGPRNAAESGDCVPRDEAWRRGESGWLLPAGARQVLLAACRSDEKAREIQVGDQIRGVFSVSLLEALKTSGAALSYRSLHQSAQAAVQAHSPQQHPQLEASDPADVDLPFLGGAVAARPRQLSVDRHRGRGWILNLGAVHGLRSDPADPSILLLFPRGTPPRHFANAEQAAGRARVLDIFAAVSRVELDFEPRPDQSGFEALMERLSVPPIRVRLTGDVTGVEDVQRAVATIGPGGAPSPLIRPIEEGGALRLQCTAEAFEIYRESETIPLTAVPREWSDAPMLAAGRLEHVAFWQQVKENIRNPNAGISPGEFAISLLQDGKTLAGPGYRLEYREENGHLKPPRFEIRFENRGQRRLYVALLALTESYEVALLQHESSAPVDPGQSLYPRGGRMLSSTIPARIAARGGTETMDTLRVLVATSEFDARPLRLPELDAATRSARGVGGLQIPRLSRPETRSMDFEQAADDPNDWLAVDLPITTVRPHPWRKLEAGETEELAAGVRVTGPKGFSALARLTAEHVEEATSATLLMVGAPLQFLTSHGNDPGLAVLELEAITGAEFVTSQHPIRISGPGPLRPHERVAAFARARRSWAQLGDSEPSGGVRIRIERVAAAADGGRVRILFRLTSGAAGG